MWCTVPCCARCAKPGVNEVKLADAADKAHHSMPKIKRSSIEAIRHQVNLVDVAGAYTQMKRAGSQWRGLSPFGTEKSPSFFVHPEKNVFMDYSSGNAGDLFRFVQLKENLNFQEAVEMLASRFNITLEYEDDGMPPERASLRKELLELHEAAADYYHRAFLSDHEQAVWMRQYWEKDRNFPLELAKQFRVGIAPATAEGLIKTLQKKQFSAEAVNASGLFYMRQGERDYSRAKPRFRGRLMIPICDVQGRVVAFTARVTELTPEDDPTAQAKYVNSPETPIFSKSHLLFGLDHARKHIKEGDPFLLVEGQLDTLRCYQMGLDCAVAPQGTAITEAQMALLRRYTNKVEVLLDGDNAGQKAALRMLPLALKAGLGVTFLPLPQGSDPDELLSKDGAQALENLRKTPLTAMTFAVRSLLPDVGKASPQDKASALERCFNLLVQCDSAVVRSDYLLELAHLARTERSALERDFHLYEVRHAENERFAAINNAQRGTASGAAGGTQGGAGGTAGGYNAGSGGSAAYGSGNTAYGSNNTTAGYGATADGHNANGANSGYSTSDGGFGTANAPANGKLTSVEEEILFVLLHFPQLSRPVSETIDNEWINNESLAGSLLSRVLAYAHEDTFEGLDYLNPVLENEGERDYIYQLVGRFSELEDPIHFINMCLKQLFQDYIRNERQKIAQQRANNPSPTPEQKEFQRQQIIKLRELTQQKPPHLLPSPPAA